MDWLNWFTNDGKYHTLYHCMAGDNTWIVIVISLSAMIGTGYAIIARKWHNASKNVPDGVATKMLQDLRMIFVLCAIASYSWPLVDLFWPAWRLYAILLFLLAYRTLRFALFGDAMAAVYEVLARQCQITESHELAKQHLERLSRDSLDRQTPTAE